MFKSRCYEQSNGYRNFFANDFKEYIRGQEWEKMKLRILGDRIRPVSYSKLLSTWKAIYISSAYFYLMPENLISHVPCKLSTPIKILAKNLRN